MITLRYKIIRKSRPRSRTRLKVSINKKLRDDWGQVRWTLYAISEFPGPLYQNEVKRSAFDMEMIFSFWCK